jgi:hypothetical protein
MIRASKNSRLSRRSLGEGGSPRPRRNNRIISQITITAPIASGQLTLREAFLGFGPCKSLNLAPPEARAFRIEATDIGFSSAAYFGLVFYLEPEIDCKLQSLSG